MEPFGATVLVICSILVVGIDTLLKPVLLGRTADAPMLPIRIVLLLLLGSLSWLALIQSE